MPYRGGYPRATELHAVRGRYDFAVDGGAVGDIDLTPEAQIPANAVVLGGFAEVDVPPTSGGAGTLAVKVEGAGDIIAAAAVSGAPWSTTGRKSVVPVFTGATSVKTTAARKIVATVATAALTAGVVDVVLFYVELPD
ncbi:hypothetical protein [Actinomadura formosensis]|uniref:hypothetical protein n=1 Tax=Actinomadura formosensis TaxID=60706 RepID=UPI003D943606